MYGNGTHVFPNCLLKREGVSTQPLGQPGSCAAQTQPSFSGLGSSPGPGLGDSQNPTERLSRAGTSPSTPPTTPHFRDHTGAVPGGGLGQRPFIRTTDWSWPPELICEQPEVFLHSSLQGLGTGAYCPHPQGSRVQRSTPFPSPRLCKRLRARCELLPTLPGSAAAQLR